MIILTLLNTIILLFLLYYLFLKPSPPPPSLLNHPDFLQLRSEFKKELQKQKNEIEKLWAVIQQMAPQGTGRKVYHVILVQAFLRMISQRRFFHKVRTSVIGLQSIWRMKNQMNHWKSVKIATIQIQSVFRQIREKRSFEKLKVGVIHLQAMIRMFVTRNHYLQSLKKIDETSTTDDFSDFDDTDESRSPVVKKFAKPMQQVSQKPSDALLKLRKKRGEVLMEVLETETKYLRYLEILYNTYYIPLTTGKAVMQKNGKNSKPVIPISLAKDIFPGDLNAIISLSRSLQSKLKEAMKDYMNDPSNMWKAEIGEVFCKTAPFLNVYITYFTVYDNALAVLKKSQKDYPLLKEWLKAQKTGLDLDALLIMPVQRIPRYKLLLGSLLDVTEKTHRDYAQLCKAAEKIGECALYQDKKIAETNGKMRVFELAKKLGCEDLVVPHRRLIREGRYKINGRRKPHKVYLFNDIMLFREPPRIGIRRRISNIFPLANAKLEDKKPLTIGIVFLRDNNYVNYEIEFPNAKEKHSFVEDLKKTLQECERHVAKTTTTKVEQRSLVREVIGMVTPREKRTSIRKNFTVN